MHRRLLGCVFAALSFLAIGLSAPDLAHAKPNGQRAESKQVRPYQTAKRNAKGTKRQVRRTNRSAKSVKRVWRSPKSVRRVQRSAKNVKRAAARQAKPSAKRQSRRHASGNPRPTVRHAARSERSRTPVARAYVAMPLDPAGRDDRFNYGPVTVLARHTDTAIARRTRTPVARDTWSGGSSDIVAEARRWLGSNPTGRHSLWCARFMNFVLERAGHKGTGSDMARSFANYGRRVFGPQVGAIAVMSRGPRGGHVGVVSGIDEKGNPIIISGNHNNRVAEAIYPRGRIHAYVIPGS